MATSLSPTRRGALRLAEAPGAYAAAGVLLASAVVALLWVATYAHTSPTLGGVPFFYWYSMLWVLVNALFQILAYLLLVRRRRLARGPGTGAGAGEAR